MFAAAAEWYVVVSFGAGKLLRGCDFSVLRFHDDRARSHTSQRQGEARWREDRL
jgi:hypothetical protein